MPILPAYDKAVFPPELTKVMGEALDLAKQSLNYSPPGIVQECMANRIIEAIQAGERDVCRLRDAAIGGAKTT